MLIRNSIVGAHLAAERSDRIIAAVLIGPVYPNDNVAPMFEKRIETVQKEGMQAMVRVLRYRVDLCQTCRLSARFDTGPCVPFPFTKHC